MRPHNAASPPTPLRPTHATPPSGDLSGLPVPSLPLIPHALAARVVTRPAGKRLPPSCIRPTYFARHAPPSYTRPTYLPRTNHLPT
eukprot:scaffold6442_cov38-Phaeocystis_antarctica.AAC.1